MNKTTSETYKNAQDVKYSNIVSRLAMMSGEMIGLEIRRMRDRAAILPKREEFESNRLRIMANDAENHFFLVINPHLAFGLNLEHAKKHGYPIP